MSHAQRLETGARPDAPDTDEDDAIAELRALARRTLELVEQASPGPWRSLGLTVLDAEAFVVARMASMRGEVRFTNDVHPNAELIAHASQALPALARAVLELLGQDPQP